MAKIEYLIMISIQKMPSRQVMRNIKKTSIFSCRGLLVHPRPSSPNLNHENVTESSEENAYEILEVKVINIQCKWTQVEILWLNYGLSKSSEGCICVSLAFGRVTCRL